MKSFVVRDSFMKGRTVATFDAETWKSPIQNIGGEMADVIESEIRKGAKTPWAMHDALGHLRVMDAEDEYRYVDCKTFEEEDAEDAQGT